VFHYPRASESETPPPNALPSVPAASVALSAPVQTQPSAPTVYNGSFLMGIHKSERRGLITHERVIGDAVILAAAGEVDMVTAPQFEEHVDRVLQRQPAALIIDLTRVDFLGSVGIGILMHAHNECGASIAYAVVADGPATSRPMHLLAVDKVIDVHPTVIDATRALGLSEARVG
jgi:anti-sigma B factor antagonist